MHPLVDSEWLAGRLDDPNVRVIDCRFVLGDPAAGRAMYLQGHIPGASFMSVDDDLSAPPGQGRHPLPDPASFAAAARRAGISATSTVVAYDQRMAGGAARLWWLLRHFGHERAAVLDGGLAAWGGPLESGAPVVGPGDFAARPRTGDVVTADDVLAGLGRADRVLLDARAPARFRGEHEPVDPVAGHIPGARNLPAADALPAPRDLVESASELIAYCGSGITASVLVLALEAAGRPGVKLYAGSWSDWVARGLPVE